MPKFKFSCNEEEEDDSEIPDLEEDYDSDNEVDDDNQYEGSRERYTPRISENIDYRMNNDVIEHENINENDINDTDDENLDDTIINDFNYQYTKRSLRSNTYSRRLWRRIMMSNILQYDELSKHVDIMIEDKISKTIMELKITENIRLML